MPKPTRDADADRYFGGLGFTPKLTPYEMLQLGVFDGYYFADEGVPAEYPRGWREGVKLGDRAEPSINIFGVHSGMTLKVWQDKGWIHEADPLGWFQWYCRYAVGRRLGTEDARQIQRWKNYARHEAMLLRQSRGDAHRGLVQRQSLVHWAYDPFPDFPNRANESTYHKILRLRG